MNAYEPMFIVELAGQNLPEDISDKVESFGYEDHEDKMDELTLTIADLDISYCDHPMLQEGKEIRARWGYAGNLSETRECTIKEISYSFGEDGAVRIDITAYDKGHKLTGRAARTCWSNKKITDIVNDIAAKHNLKPVVSIPDDFARDALSQGGKNDFVFLRELASEMGCKTWVTNEELHFEPNDAAGKATHVFRYREDGEGLLKSFSITANAEKGKGTGRETEVSGVDPVTKKPFQEKTTANKENVTVNLESGREDNETPFQPKADETGTVSPTPSVIASQAMREAKWRVQGAGMNTVEGSAELVGIPSLKAKDVISIENISEKFSGNWRVKSVRHEINDGGYACSAEVVRSDTNAGGGQRANGGKVSSNNKQSAASDNKANGPKYVEAYVG